MPKPNQSTAAIRYDAGRGEPVKSHFTLDAKRAAEDLSRVREAEVADQQPPIADVANAVDAVPERIVDQPAARSTTPAADQANRRRKRSTD